MRPPSLLEALADPELFASHFRGPSWTGWKAFLAALTAGPMDEAALALYRRCTARTTPPTAAFSEACLVVGRRGGKSRVLALIAVFLACFRDYTPHLAPGEVATIAVLASNRAPAGQSELSSRAPARVREMNEFHHFPASLQSACTSSRTPLYLRRRCSALFVEPFDATGWAMSILQGVCRRSADSPR